MTITVLCVAPPARAGAFSRWGTENASERLAIIRRGLVGQLNAPEEKAQFEILMCRPRRAWNEAEKIKDPAIQARFFATILALSAIPRFETLADEMDEVPQTVLPKSAIAAKFALDMSEVWADEPADTTVPPSCDFPLAKIENRPALIEAARSQFKLADEKPENLNQSFPVIALRSDLGLNPQVSAENLKEFGSRHPNSPYLARLQYFFKQQVSEPVKFDIRGTSASLSELDFSDANLEPHSLELPWLLR